MSAGFDLLLQQQPKQTSGLQSVQPPMPGMVLLLVKPS